MKQTPARRHHRHTHSPLSLLQATAVSALLSMTLLAGCQRSATHRDPAELRAAPAVALPPLIRLASCWAAEPLARDLADAFAQQSTSSVVDIQTGNSSHAASQLTAGGADVAITIEPITPLDGGTIGDWAEQSFLAIDAFGIIVHPDSPLEDVTLAELRTIYAGQVVSWANLTGEDAVPEIVTLPETSALRRTFEELVMEQLPITSAAVIAAEGQDALDYVATHRYAIGYIPMCRMETRVKLLTLDGRAPIAQQVKSGEYALSYRLVVSLAPEAPQEAKQFLAFATSDAGRELTEQRYIAGD